MEWLEVVEIDDGEKISVYNRGERVNTFGYTQVNFIEAYSKARDLVEQVKKENRISDVGNYLEARA